MLRNVEEVWCEGECQKFDVKGLKVLMFGEVCAEVFF